MNSKQLVKIISVNSLLISLILIFGELVARSFFSDFKGDFYSENITRSINYHKSSLNGIEIVRTPGPDFSIDSDSDILLIIGDSITEGYGMIYEDIYWVKLKNLVNLTKKEKIEVIPTGGYGSNLSKFNLIKKIKKISETFPKNKIYLMYQFNFNDIHLENSRITTKKKNIFNHLNASFGEFALRHLHKSVFARTVRHYGSTLKRKRINNKNCQRKDWINLQSYTYTYASKGFEKESEIAWDQFERKLFEIKKIASEINAEFIMFITPIIYDIDINGVHPYYNPYRLDFSCATLDPRKRLNAIAKDASIKLIDPTIYMREKFEAILKEGNFRRFYYAADDNHITPYASTYLSNYLFTKIFSNMKE